MWLCQVSSWIPVLARAARASPAASVVTKEEEMGHSRLAGQAEEAEVGVKWWVGTGKTSVGVARGG